MGAPGDIIDGRFELLERLGSGGMGTVWRARDTVLGREVALKEMRASRPGLSDRDREVLRERALREGRALGRIRHPHVVTIHQVVQLPPDPDTGEVPQPWLVMELLPGRTLDDLAAEAPLDPVETARLGRQVLSALRAAHAAGVHHRDVKPANIMLREDGSAVLTDFGIATLRDAGTLTVTGQLIGSPEYMAPERVRGSDDDPASDLWSLGLVLYAAVQGVSPLRRTTTFGTLTAVLEDAVPPATRSGPLAPVLSALLVREPRERPDPAQLDALLAAVENGRTPRWARATVTAPDPSAAGQGGAEARAGARPTATARSRAMLVVAVVAVVVAVVTTTALLLALSEGGGDGPQATGDPAHPGVDVAAPSAPAGSGEPSRHPSRSPSGSPSAGASASGVPGRTDPSRSVAAPPDAGPAGTWIAQLASVERSRGTTAREQQAAALRARGLSGVRVLSSDRFAALRPGYWVFYVPDFATGREAVEYCRSKGLVTRDSCVGRYISNRSADFVLQCYPTARGVQPGSRCTRD
ncbi:protein kinase [Streptomyces sp. NPDC127068]|uniref:serine/threonine-protein kinase n=1 Tax=Streptomyces sp. NPDC127068 TaxID=3347127 RepID=UPI003658173D